MLTFADRILGLHLGLGDLAGYERCHGYANCCACSECKERARQPLAASERPRQPWEGRAA